MSRIKIDSTVKGTDILVADTATKKRGILNTLNDVFDNALYDEIFIPILQPSTLFHSKVGQENQNLMYEFKDRGGRDLCLAPEYTAVIIELAKSHYKYKKDVKIFYVAECFRGEKPQAGRYRQFTQFGVEVINPAKDYLPEFENLINEAFGFLYDPETVKKFVWDKSAIRGLDYYKASSGFEISYPDLGGQKQICGGGSYDGGTGFALGIDRLLLI